MWAERDTGVITFRQATSFDAGALALIGAATMLETYADKIDGADIVAHSARRHSTDFYAAWLQDPTIIIWLAQTQTNAAIGYLVLMPATLPAPQPDPSDLEVQRIYVLSRFHTAGVGHHLMTLAIDAARARSARQLVLGVMKKNERALAFYRRQGFTEIGTRTFHVGAATFDDYVLGLPLNGTNT